VKNISVVIIVKNGEATLDKTLTALKRFSEVILYDNGSTDNTLQIASKYNNVVLIQGDFLGFGESKNFAANFAKNDWIFSLDADEVVSEALVEFLEKTTLNSNTVYQIFRKNFYKNTHIKHCWNNDIITRIYHKNSTQFNDKKVHESVIKTGFELELLPDFVEHYPYQNISNFIQKLDMYSTQFAEDNAGKKNSSPLKAFLNSGFSFVKTYFFKRGFLDGYAGLVIAFSHMATNFYKYIKLYELNKKL
jgi:glycosyltransferase involved in cell wall biosynthesis